MPPRIRSIQANASASRRQSFHLSPRMRFLPPLERHPPGEAFTWQDLAANCDEIELGDLLVQVAHPKMLYRMKKDTVRPQDRADAARIREAFGLGDE